MKSNLVKIIEKNDSPNVLVLGDLMLDKYTFGSVKRISPEAPIPILQVLKEEYKLGGALNVANNLKTLGCEVDCVGVIGKDSGGERLLLSLKGIGININGIIQDAQRPTTLKIRNICGNHQLLRVDYETIHNLPAELENKALDYVISNLDNYSIIVVSDYNKGFLTESLLSEIIKRANKKNIPIFCDPRNDIDYKIYKGMTLIKPNRTEAEKVSNISCSSFDNIIKASKYIVEEAQIQFLALSLDKDGIFLYEKGGSYQVFPTEAKEVYDVTGAGDVVISVLSYIYGSGNSITEAVKLANIAAGIKLGKLGACSVTKSEILRELNRETAEISSKLKSKEDILQICDQEKQLKKQVVFTNGTFDQLQLKHIQFLRALKQYQGIVIVGLNSDNSIMKLSGQKPILNERERAEILGTLEVVDYIVLYEEETADAIIDIVKPDIYVKGKRPENKPLPETDTLKKYNTKIEFIDFINDEVLQW